MMKSQDLLILLKIISLHQGGAARSEDFSVRALASATGIGKTEIGASINRSMDVGLLKHDRKTGLPKANSKALLDFISYGLRYVFPAEPGALQRGLLTGLEAPGLEGLLSSLAQYHYVWPDGQSADTGQAIVPLYKTAAFAARRDSRLYQLMALVDAVRLGDAREVAIARAALKDRLSA